MEDVGVRRGWGEKMGRLKVMFSIILADHPYQGGEIM